MATKKFTITLAESIGEKIEDLRLKKGLTRSAMIAIAVEEYIRKESQKYIDVDK